MRVLGTLLMVFFSFAHNAFGDDPMIPLAGVLPGKIKNIHKPYLVFGSVTVPKGSRTIIEKGVVLLFKNFTNLTVEGSLYALGTKEEPVIFSSENDSAYNKESTTEPAPFDWDGIIISNPETMNILSFCVVQYSLYGIKSLSPRTILKECNFFQNGNTDFVLLDKAQKISSRNFSYIPANITESMIASETAPFSDSVQLVKSRKQPVKEQAKKTDSVTVVLQQEKQIKPIIPMPDPKPVIKPVSQESPSKPFFTPVRVTSFLAISGGIMAGLYELKKYNQAKITLDHMKENTPENKMTNSREEFFSQAKKANLFLAYMITGFSISYTGTIILTFSFSK